MNCKKTISLLLVLLAAGCAGTGKSKPRADVFDEDQQLASAPSLTEPDRVIHKDDMVKITLRMPDRTIGSFEAVQKSGDVATPDGSFVKADGLTLNTFRTNLVAMYAPIATYQDVKVDAFIWSSPYKVIKYNPNLPQPAAPTVSTNAPTTPSNAKAPPPTLFPRIFRAPLTLWEAIQLEGGIPQGVRANQIHVLKQGFVRKTYDCSGAGGLPDGKTPVENGDHIFLVPEGTAISGIFD